MLLPRTLILCIVLGAILPLTMTLANAQVWSVEVQDNSTDSVGQRLVFLVKEGIRKSSSMELTVADVPRVVLIIKTMPGYSDYAQLVTVFAATWVLRRAQETLGLYLNSTVGYAGTDVLSRSAETIVANTDRLLSGIAKDLLRSK